MANTNSTPESPYYQITGNPLIDALPPQITLQDFYHEMTQATSLPADYKSLSSTERFALAEDMANIFLPLDFSAIVYNSVYSGIRSAYKGKTPVSIVKQLNETGKNIFYKKPLNLQDAKAQAECFSVLGEPGMGKTLTLKKVLSLLPQVIHHTEYQGRPFEHEQIVYVTIESPANNSPRGACLQLLAAVDELLGTDLCAEERSRSSNLDMLITRISQICTRYSIGCIVIDEIQNVLLSRPINKKYEATTGGQMVKFLVELANKTGVCLVFVGIPAAARVFDIEPHLARRTRGPRVAKLENDRTFKKLLETLWDNMPVLYHVPLTQHTQDLIYKITGGVIAKMQKLITLSAQHAIYFGTEMVNEALLTKTAKQYNIVPSQSMLQAAAPELLEPPTIRRDVAPDVRPTKEKGRPKAKREEDDIMEIFSRCYANGWSVTTALIQQGLAERR